MNGMFNVPFPPNPLSPFAKELTRGGGGKPRSVTFQIITFEFLRKQLIEFQHWLRSKTCTAPTVTAPASAKAGRAMAARNTAVPGVGNTCSISTGTMRVKMLGIAC